MKVAFLLPLQQPKAPPKVWTDAFLTPRPPLPLSGLKLVSKPELEIPPSLPSRMTFDAKIY